MVSPEYKEWEKEKEKKKQELLEELKSNKEKNIAKERIEFEEEIEQKVDIEIETLKEAFQKHINISPRMTYDDWERKRENMISEKKQMLRISNPPLYSRLYGNTITYFPYEIDKIDNLDDSNRPQYYEYPVFKPIIAGLISASLTFVVLLVGIRWTSRGTKRLSLWIIEGFKDDNN